MEQLLESARERDRQDELRDFRDAFWIPPDGAGGDQIYFCGHSLGLQPRTADAALDTEMKRWRELAVSGHFRGQPGLDRLRRRPGGNTGRTWSAHSPAK